MISASLFSGAGFGDMGFRAMGFFPALLCEIDPKRTAFTKINFPQSEVLTCDISENVENIIDRINKILEQKKKINFSFYMPHHHVKACLKMESDLSLKLWQIIKGHRSTKEIIYICQL